MLIDRTSKRSLHTQIYDLIKSEIISANRQVDQKLPTQKELAVQYNVSMITIKKALNDLIRNGYLYSIVGSGTFVAKRSAALNFEHQKAIGLVLVDLKSPFFSKVMQSVEEHVSQKGYTMLLSKSEGNVDREKVLVENLVRTGVDGLIIASMSHEHYSTGILKKLQREDFPFVMVSYIEDKDICYIGTDNEAGGYLAAQHLIATGRNKIGYINGEQGNLLGELRKKGFLKALQEHQIPFTKEYEFRLELKYEWNDFESGYKIGKSFADIKNRPDAIFAYNDLSALGFMKGVLESGLKVPEDLAIIGFDDIERCQYASVPLTT
ncbi:MAG: GntR family transcriptional regulator, partial [Bacteroidetes bacterium]|nr:GntR family transcriptional regulator [Bacteroidota bacterium]